MALPHHRHVCRVCGHATTYHIHEGEQQGDAVAAYCEECGDDTPHLIREGVGR